MRRYLTLHAFVCSNRRIALRISSGSIFCSRMAAFGWCSAWVRKRRLCLQFPAPSRSSFLRATKPMLLAMRFILSCSKVAPARFTFSLWTTTVRMELRKQRVEAASNSSRPDALTVIHGQPLPDGWTGKLWAMQQGIEQALRLHPQFLLLTDADIQHSPENVATLVSRCRTWRL